MATPQEEAKDDLSSAIDAKDSSAAAEEEDVQDDEEEVEEIQKEVEEAEAGEWNDSNDETEVCEFCGMPKADFKFCGETGERHVIKNQKCPECGLNTKFCPVTGKPHIHLVQQQHDEARHYNYSRGTVQDTADAQANLLRQRRSYNSNSSSAQQQQQQHATRLRRTYDSGQPTRATGSGGTNAAASFIGQGMNQDELDELQRTGFGIFLADNPALKRAPLSGAARAGVATGAAAGGGGGGNAGEEMLRRLGTRSDAMDYFNSQAVSEALNAMKSGDAGTGKRRRMFQAPGATAGATGGVGVGGGGGATDTELMMAFMKQHQQQEQVQRGGRSSGLLAAIRANKWKILALFCLIIFLNSRRLFTLFTASTF